MPNNYDQELTKVKNSVNNLLFRSGGNKDAFVQINQLYEDIEKSTDKNETKKLIQSLKTTILDNPIVEAAKNDNATKALYDEIQKNLAEFVKKKWNESFGLGFYAKTLEGGSSPEELEKLINDSPEPFDQVSKIILRGDEMVDANGKPINLINHYRMDVQPLKDKDGNVIKDKDGNVSGYSISSEDPVSLVQNCVAMGKHDIITENFHNSLLKRGDSRKHIEDMFREANKNLFYINVEVNYGTGQNAKNHPITSTGMMDRQSKEGQKLININKALKTVHDNNPNANPYEKTISTYALLLDEGKKEEAQMFLNQQYNLHSEDKVYMHNLNVEAFKQSTNPHKEYDYEKFCKAMSLKEDVSKAQEETKETIYQNHLKTINDVGELEKMTHHLLIAAQFLPDEFKEDFRTAVTEIVEKRTELLDKLETLNPNQTDVSEPDFYDINEIDEEVENLKKSLKDLETELNNRLKPEKEPELIVEDEIGPDTSPYSSDELNEFIERGVLPVNLTAEIESLEKKLEVIDITPTKAKAQSDKSFGFVFGDFYDEEVKKLEKEYEAYKELVDNTSIEEKTLNSYPIEKLAKILPSEKLEEIHNTRKELSRLREYVSLTPEKAEERLEKVENMLKREPENKFLLTERECLDHLIESRDELKDSTSFTK